LPGQGPDGGRQTGWPFGASLRAFEAHTPEPQWLSDSAGARRSINGSEDMPKIKTSRGAAKRFARTASGKYKHKQSHLRHLLTKKRTKRKRDLRKRDIVSEADAGHLRRLLPYA